MEDNISKQLGITMIRYNIMHVINKMVELMVIIFIKFIACVFLLLLALGATTTTTAFTHCTYDGTHSNLAKSTSLWLFPDKQKLFPWSHSWGQKPSQRITGVRQFQRMALSTTPDTDIVDITTVARSKETVTVPDNTSSCEAAEKAELALYKCIQDYKNHNVNIRSPSITSNRVTDKNTMNNDSSKNKTPRGKKQNNKHIVIDKPKESSFQNLIYEWLLLQLPHRAERILDTMEELHTPSGRIYERIIHAYCQHALLNTAPTSTTTNYGNNETSHTEYNDGEISIKQGQEECTLLDKPSFDDSNIHLSTTQILSPTTTTSSTTSSYRSALRALHLLNRLEQLYLETKDLDFRPALSTYSTVINALVRTSFLQRKQRLKAGGNLNNIGNTSKNTHDISNNSNNMNELVDQIRKSRDSIYTVLLPPQVTPFTLTTDESILKILDYLDNGEQIKYNLAQRSNGSNTHRQNDDSYQDNRGIRSDIHTDRMKSIVVNTHVCNVIINELAKLGSTQPWTGQVAEDILDYMIKCYSLHTNFSSPTSSTACHHQYSRPHYHLKPNIKTINACINTWAQCTSHPNSALKAEGILQKLNALQQPQSELSPSSSQILLDVTPNSVSYNTIIKAYSNIGNAEKAESILNTMEELYHSTKNKTIQPDLVSYCSVLNAYSKASKVDPTAAKKAEDILVRMTKDLKRVYNNTDYQPDSDGEDKRAVIPNTWCFNTVLNAHAERGAGIRAVLILKLMEDMSHMKNGQPNSFGNNITDVPSTKVKPDIFTYNTVLKALANSNESGCTERANQILYQLEQQQNMNDSKSNCIVVTPDVITYNTVILAYANHGGRGAGRKADEILKKMQNRYRNGDVSLKPTRTTYTSVIKAWISSGIKGNIRRVEEIIDSLEEAEKNHDNDDSSGLSGILDTTIYNAYIHCIAKYNDRNTIQKAEDVLVRMEQQYQITRNERIKPNFRTYSSVIDVLSKSREKGSSSAPYRALEILDRMEKLYKAGDMSVRPNVYTYSSVINCFARSTDPNKSLRAYSILERMEEQYRGGNSAARPNEIAFNSVLNACAYTQNIIIGDFPQDSATIVESAFRTACTTFDQIRTCDYVRPGDITYGTFLSVCANLMPESEVRDNLVEAVFKRCAKDGLVSQMVLRKLSIAASPKLFDSLLKIDTSNPSNSKNSDIPSSWSRNL